MNRTYTGIFSSLVLGIALAGCADSGGGDNNVNDKGDGGLVAPVADTTGTWSVTENIFTDTCPTGNETEMYTGTVEQNGNIATFHKPAINTSSSSAVNFKFTISGNSVTLSSTTRYSKRSGTVTVSNLDLTISKTGSTLEGTTVWSWSNGNPLYDCLGSSTFYAMRATGAGTKPTAPSNTYAQTVSSSSIEVTWVDNSTDESSFVLERSMSSGSGYEALPLVIPAAANSGSTVHYTNTNLAAGTYYYRVKARNVNGDSGYSAVANATTTGSGGAVTAPSAPTNPLFSNITSSSATLSWTDNSDDEAGFEVGTCSGLVDTASNGLLSCVGTFNLVATKSPSVTSHNITGLAAGTSYSYFVRAVNSAGASGNLGRSFTTMSDQQTVTLAAQYENIVSVNNLDPAVANTVYKDFGFFIGCDTYYALTGFPNYICSAGLLRFNISALSGKTIASATLTLIAAGADIGYYPRTWKVEPLASVSTWSTQTVTWNTAPGSVYSALATFYAPTYAGQPYTISITSTVQNWANGSWANNGLLLESSSYSNLVNTSSSDRFGLYGRLNTAGPKLVVVYH